MIICQCRVYSLFLLPPSGQKIKSVIAVLRSKNLQFHDNKQMPRQNPSAEEHCVIPSDNYKKDFALRLFFWTDVFLDYGIKQCKSWARLWFFFLCFSILDTMLYLFFQTKATLNRWASKWSSILNSHSLSLITFKVQKIQTKTNRQINLPFFFQSLWKKKHAE